MRELVERHAPELLELALAEVGDDPFARAGEGTAYAQPAISARASPRWIAAPGARRPRSSPATRSASSSALAAAGAIDPADGRPPGRRPRPADAATPPSDEPGGMLALLGDAEQARARCAERGGAVVANDNGPDPDRRRRARATALDAAAAEAKAARRARDAAAGRAAPFTPRRWRRRSSPSGRRSTRSTIGRPGDAGLLERHRRAVRHRRRRDPRPARGRARPARCAGARRSSELHRRGVRSFVEAGPGQGADRDGPARLRRRRGRRVLGRARRRPMPEAATSLEPSRRASAPAPAPRRRGRRVGVAVPRDRGRQRRRSPRASASSEDWIVARTGVRERRIAGPGRAACRLAAEAGRRALAAAGVDAGEVDLVLVATMSHELPDPERRAAGRRRGSARRTPARSTSARPARDSSRRSPSPPGRSRRAGRGRCWSIGADLLSRLTDPDDRATAALFGDGAGAVVRQRRATGAGRIGPADPRGRRRAASELITAAREEGVDPDEGPRHLPPGGRPALPRRRSTRRRGRRPRARRDRRLRLPPGQRRILAAVGERLGLDPARVIDCIDRYGNTSAATIPLALAEAQRRRACSRRARPCCSPRSAAASPGRRR